MNAAQQNLHAKVTEEEEEKKQPSNKSCAVLFNKIELRYRKFA